MGSTNHCSTPLPCNLLARITHLGRNSLTYQCRYGAELPERSSAEDLSGVTVSPQRALVAEEAGGTPVDQQLAEGWP